MEGILPARSKATWWWSLGLTQPLVFLRGLENMLYDFIDHPDEIKALLGILCRGFMDKLDYWKRKIY